MAPRDASSVLDSLVPTAALPRFLYPNPETLQHEDLVSTNNVCDLVLQIIAHSPKLSWIRVLNTQIIIKFVVLLVPGLTPTVLFFCPFPPPP
ncbi:hypothetical protein V8E53_000139 [Lactarius tabidus]